VFALFGHETVYAYVSVAIRIVPEINIPENKNNRNEDQSFINILE
jgi:hypothetical protein